MSNRNLASRKHWPFHLTQKYYYPVASALLIYRSALLPLYCIVLSFFCTIALRCWGRQVMMRLLVSVLSRALYIDLLTLFLFCFILPYRFHWFRFPCVFKLRSYSRHVPICNHSVYSGSMVSFILYWWFFHSVLDSPIVFMYQPPVSMTLFSIFTVDEEVARTSCVSPSYHFLFPKHRNSTKKMVVIPTHLTQRRLLYWQCSL